MVHVRFNFVFMWLLTRNIKLGKAAGDLVTYSFTKVTATLLNNTQYRLASAPWTGLSSSLTCASEALHSYPDSRAYVFEPGSGLCTPFLWLHEGTGLASTELPPGNLYVSQGQLCPYPFQGVLYGSDRQVSCVFTITPATSYQLATSQCVSLGGHLISVWTPEKLDLVARLANGKEKWVGLDDIVDQGRLIWQQDGSEITTAWKQAVFARGEPSSANERCIVLWTRRNKLGDYRCNYPTEGLCETSPLK